MHLSSLIEMIESGFGDRVLVGGRNEHALSGLELADLVRRGWQAVADSRIAEQGDEQDCRRSSAASVWSDSPNSLATGTKQVAWVKVVRLGWASAYTGQ